MNIYPAANFSTINNIPGGIALYDDHDSDPSKRECWLDEAYNFLKKQVRPEKLTEPFEQREADFLHPANIKGNSIDTWVCWISTSPNTCVNVFEQRLSSLEAIVAFIAIYKFCYVFKLFACERLKNILPNTESNNTNVNIFRNVFKNMCDIGSVCQNHTLCYVDTKTMITYVCTENEFYSVIREGGTIKLVDVQNAPDKKDLIPVGNRGINI